MKVVEMREAFEALSELVDSAAAGEPFVIAEDGKSLVIVTALQPDDLS